MGQSRRQFLKAGAAAAAGLATAPLAAAKPRTLKRGAIAGAITSLFNKLPGDIALKILAPSTGDEGGLQVQLNPGRRLFVASADNFRAV